MTNILELPVGPGSGQELQLSGGIDGGIDGGDVQVRPWPDPYLDAGGHDPRSAYVETYWLSILGPSATWFLRRVAGCLEAEPAGFVFDTGEWARWLGLGSGRAGHDVAIFRVVKRCLQFGAARIPHEGASPAGREGAITLIEVRRRLPTLSVSQSARLPEDLRERHRRAVESGEVRPVIEIMRERSRALALSLLRTGEEIGSVERQLVRWRFHPALARESAAWAWDRHCSDGS